MHRWFTGLTLSVLLLLLVAACGGGGGSSVHYDLAGDQQLVGEWLWTRGDHPITAISLGVSGAATFSFIGGCVATGKWFTADDEQLRFRTTEINSAIYCSQPTINMRVDSLLTFDYLLLPANILTLTNDDGMTDFVR